MTRPSRRRIILAPPLRPLLSASSLSLRVASGANWREWGWGVREEPNNKTARSLVLYKSFSTIWLFLSPLYSPSTARRGRETEASHIRSIPKFSPPANTGETATCLSSLLIFLLLYALHTHQVYYFLARLHWLHHFVTGYKSVTAVTDSQL